MLELNRQQKNQIFEIIKHNKFDTSRFHWGLRNSEFNTIQSGYAQVAADAQSLDILVGDEVFYFTFERSNTYPFVSSMRPYPDGRPYAGERNWEMLLSRFVNWLALLKSEMEEPDLWNTPFQEPAFKMADNGEADIPFTEQEKQKLRLALDKIEDKIIKIADPSQEHISVVNHQFLYLKQKLETLSKGEWRHIFRSVLIHIFAEPWLAPYAEELKAFLLTEGRHLVGSLWDLITS